MKVPRFFGWWLAASLLCGLGASAAEPEYIVLGDKGALTCNGEKIKLKYLDPKHKLPPRKPNPGDPNFQFGSPDDLKWIEEEIPVSPAKKIDMTMIWDDLYAAVRLGKKFPITLDQAVEVMRVISMTKKGTKFA